MLSGFASRRSDSHKSTTGPSRIQIAAVFFALLFCAVRGRAQTDFLTYTGVWSTLPVTGLGTPSAVTGDSNGNLYITDTTQSSVIKYAADGTQSTIGTSLQSPKGITADASANVYVTSYTDGKVYKITPGGSQTSIGSGWTHPVSIAVDAFGNVYVTDDSGLSEVTSGGSQSLLQSSSSIRGVALATNGDLFYANNASNQVYRIPYGTSTPEAHNFTDFTENLYVDQLGNLFMAQTEDGVQRADDTYSDHTEFGDALVSEGVWEDNKQNLYIADANGSIEKLALGPADLGSAQVCPTGATVTPCSTSATLHFSFDSLVFGTPSMRTVTQGVLGLDYSITSDGCSANLVDGAACTIVVTFTPVAPGLRTGAAQAVGYSEYDSFAAPVGPRPRRVQAPVRPRDEPPGTLLSQVLLKGIALAPVGVFSTAPIQTSQFTPLPNNYLYGVTVAADGSLYITDADNCVVQRYSGNTTTIVAGTTCGPSAGDGSAATSATLRGPLRTVLDGAGNLYIADNAAQNVREVQAGTGLISTVAGTGTVGYTGDGGLAINATFEQVADIALDSDGNFYVADGSNASVVRRIDAVTGVITTIAGTGSEGYTGDGGPATSARLSGPDGIALDNAGNLFIADDNNNVIREVSNGIITTIAGTGTAGYSGDGGPATSAEMNDPEGLQLDIAGNVYFPDSQNNVVRRVNVATGIITTVAGAFNVNETYTGDNGPAIQAGMSYAEDVAVGPDGTIYIDDSDNHVLRQVNALEGAALFGSVAQNSTPAPTIDVTFSNLGTSSLTQSVTSPANYSIGGADTTCTSLPTLIVDASCVLGVEQLTTTAGTFNETMVVNDNLGNAPSATQTIAISGAVTNAVATQLAFSGTIAPVTAGGNLGTVLVNVEDVNGIVIAGATNSVTLTITGPGGYSHTVTVSAVNGVASFNLSSLPLSTVGSYTLTATSGDLTQAQTSATVNTGNVNAPAQLAFSNTIATTLPAGSSVGSVPVDVENSMGSLLSAATNSITLTITGPSGYSHNVTLAATAGVANFNLSSLTLTTPGVYTLTATSAGLTQAVATLTVTASTPTTPVQLTISAGSVPATLAAGGSLGTVQVEVNNASGALVTSATNAVTITITGPGGYSYTTTVTAVGGIAAFDLSSLSFTTPGTYTLTATSGHMTAAIATFTITVDFTIAVAGGTPGSANIPPGAVAGFTFSLAPASGSFSSPITLTATGLPAGATYSFSPASVTPGASAAPTALTIHTVRGETATLVDQHLRPGTRGTWTRGTWTRGWGTAALALILLPFPLSRRMRRAARRGPLWCAVLLLLSLGTVAGLSGCGAGGLFGQPQQTYTITVTGTSGSLSHAATVTLTVQ